MRLLVTLGIFGLFHLAAHAQCGGDYDRDVDQILSATQALPHEQPRIVFAGSSTFRLWEDMAYYFPGYEVVNAGIGGSCFSDLNRYREQLLAGTEPDAIVLYEGDNDAAHVESVDAILAEAKALFDWLEAELPDVPVLVLSPKPSLARWELVAKYYRLNGALRELAEGRGADYLDAWPLLTDDQGAVVADFFIQDGLHLNADGNARLAKLIATGLHKVLPDEEDYKVLNAFVDHWHRAAAKADSSVYFRTFASGESIFQGTDGSEYWTAEEFAQWAGPYFRRESAWTFTPVERHWYRRGNVLWFSERLDSEHMGPCRGTGILVKTGSGFKIDHYSLSFEIPNAVVDEIVPIADPRRAEILDFQRELNEQYRDPEHSPLSEEDRLAFTEHTFYPMDFDYIVQATLIRTPDEKPFQMATSTGRPAMYRKYADATFTLHGVVHRVPVYQSLRLMEMEGYENYLFLPFKDRLTGVETYGSGRYLGLEIPESGDVITINFNLAYNPYCAYSDRYTCPITPSENFIDAEIRAGIQGPAH